MGISLYDALTNNSDSTKKSSIGYTVKSYLGVLEDLEQLRVKVINRLIQDSSGSTAENYYSTRYYTVLKSDSYDENLTLVDGFFMDGDKPMYQGLCTLKDYMSFFVDVLGSKKAYVPVSNGGNIASGDGGLSNGIAYPFNLKDKSKLANMQNDKCYIGVALSTLHLVKDFLKKYFEKLGLHNDSSKILKIAAQGMLYAEVVIPNGKGSALYFHAKVTALKQTSDTGPYLVWMPIPVLLLNDFSKICSIGVTGVENTASQVGKGKVTYPLAGSRYYHKDATVDGLTKTLLEQYLNVPKENVATVNYSNSSLNNGGKETQGRVRIYFDKAAASIIGQIPELYATELFKGHFSSDEVTASESFQEGGNYAFNSLGGIFIDVGHVGDPSQGKTHGTGANTATGVDEYWFNHNLGKSLARKLTAAQIPVKLYDIPNSDLSDNIPEIKRVNKEFKKGSYAAFVSIHCNSYGPNELTTTWVGAREGYGGSIVFTGKNSGKHPQSDVLGAMVAKSLNSAWKRQGEMTGLKVLKSSTTVAHASYMVLSDKTSPAILIETGYVNHADDVKWMETPDGIDKLTTAIANAIKEWLSTVKN